MSHIRTVISFDPDMSLDSSFAQHKERTQSVCPSNGKHFLSSVKFSEHIVVMLLRSHLLIDLSKEPENKYADVTAKHRT